MRTYPTTYYDCNDNCLNDTDGDSVCDELEIAGCTIHNLIMIHQLQTMMADVFQL